MTTSLIIKPEQKRLNRSIHTGVGQTNIRINLAPETGNRAQFARQMPEQRHHGSKRLDRSAEQRQGGREDVPLGECQLYVKENSLHFANSCLDAHPFLINNHRLISVDGLCLTAEEAPCGPHAKSSEVIFAECEVGNPAQNWDIPPVNGSGYVIHEMSALTSKFAKAYLTSQEHEALPFHIIEAFEPIMGDYYHVSNRVTGRGFDWNFDLKDGAQKLAFGTTETGLLVIYQGRYFLELDDRNGYRFTDSWSEATKMYFHPLPDNQFKMLIDENSCIVDAGNVDVEVGSCNSDFAVWLAK
ncbi:hypothetical protein [Pseudophaeobacter sp. TrK17]|uniref:hypothetical protein n=1 Tax=Pseudophaeobacter sp. TrK17 TaxID=2815167 RepID=UPI0035D105F9